jgi:TRAP-type C4-dicarboxylate transport system substrate-binding protein
MQVPDGDDPDAAYFADQVRAETNGRVRIAIDGETYASSDPDNELRLVRALRRGDVAIAYLPSRAWERDGLRSFRALQAPFLVTDYGLLRRVVEGEVGRSMLESLGRVSLVGLGLVPKELRRPLGRRPLVSSTAFRGARVRVVTSPSSILMLHALGATPLTNFTSPEARAALASKKLDGVESEMHSIEDNNYVVYARYLPSNLVLFAKVQTIVIRRDALDRLSGRDRDALRAAARATVAQADPGAQERGELERLCRHGLRLVRASAADLASLHQSVEPVYETLERDPTTRRAVAAIQALKRAEPASAALLPACPAAKPTGRSKSSSFPQGAFESRITADDFRRGGARVDPTFPVPWRITIRGGHWRTNEHPPFSGHYTVRDDQITFFIEAPHDNVGVRETVRWSYYRGKLRLRVVDVADSGSRVIYTSHPWRRTGS